MCIQKGTYAFMCKTEGWLFILNCTTTKKLSYIGNFTLELLQYSIFSAFLCSWKDAMYVLGREVILMFGCLTSLTCT